MVWGSTGVYRTMLQQNKFHQSRVEQVQLRNNACEPESHFSHLQVIKLNSDLMPEHHQWFLFQMLRFLNYLHQGRLWLLVLIHSMHLATSSNYPLLNYSHQQQKHNIRNNGESHLLTHFTLFACVQRIETVHIGAGNMKFTCELCTCRTILSSNHMSLVSIAACSKDSAPWLEAPQHPRELGL